MTSRLSTAAALALLQDAHVDVRYATRLFARQPAILLLTIAGLSLGLGIATAAFSIMNAAVLRGEGLADSSRRSKGKARNRTGSRRGVCARCWS